MLDSQGRSRLRELLLLPSAVGLVLAADVVVDVVDDDAPMFVLSAFVVGEGM